MKVHAAWMRVEAKSDGDKYRWLVNGEQADADRLQKLLGEYAEKLDSTAELRGKNKDGISPNPVVFSSGPDVTSQAFYGLIELMVSANMYRFIVELSVEGRAPRRIWQQFPVDEGLNPVEQDGDALSDPRDWLRAQADWKFYLRVVRDGNNYVYETYLKPREATTHEDTRFSLDQLLQGGWNESLYASVRGKLTQAILTRQGSGKAALEEVEITPMRDVVKGGPYAHWAPVFLAMDAIDLANNSPGRGERPDLFTMFRFTDALERFK
ncbi:MAG: hypothetical protein H6841_07500 [Planctomycetes bacterium]|nr:hypothetical protein [Planctomycetota bacterium]MCB9935202.1 hypothetical protein [Planctomycetota bacterium]